MLHCLGSAQSSAIIILMVRRPLSPISLRPCLPLHYIYSQLEKEVLALVAGVKWVHEYIYSRHFDLITDHRLLLGLLARDCQMPQVLSLQMLW